MLNHQARGLVRPGRNQQAATKRPARGSTRRKEADAEGGPARGSNPRATEKSAPPEGGLSRAHSLPGLFHPHISRHPHNLLHRFVKTTRVHKGIACSVDPGGTKNPAARSRPAQTSPQADAASQQRSSVHRSKSTIEFAAILSGSRTNAVRGVPKCPVGLGSVERERGGELGLAVLVAPGKSSGILGALATCF